jgi:hypothetical protein
MFGTYKNPITGNDKLMGLDDYYFGNFNNLLSDKPEI